MEALLIVIAVLALLAGGIWLKNGRGMNRSDSFSEAVGGSLPRSLGGPLGTLLGRNSIRSLRREIYQLFGPMDDGQRILERTLNSLRRQYPDQSERWYYEKALHDLRRDRGR